MFNFIKKFLINIGTLELIKISKNDFVDIIKDNLRLYWNSNLIAMQNLPQFNYLSLEDLNKCSTVSFIKTFKKYEHVLSKYNSTHYKLKLTVIEKINRKTRLTKN
jgi:hypothetical protein